MKKLFRSTIIISIFLASFAEANTNIEFINKLTEPILFEINIIALTNECENVAIDDVLTYLDQVRAYPFQLSIYDFEKKAYSYKRDYLAKEHSTHYKRLNVNAYKVNKSLIYRGSEIVINVYASYFKFLNNNDIPAHQLVRADMDADCRLRNFRIGSKYVYYGD